MKTAFAILLACLVTYGSVSSAQTPLWQGKGRIVISSDGNEHDHDDWAATPLSLAMLAARGLQDKLILYTYSDHVWGSNQTCPDIHGISAYEHMRISALGSAQWFGFDKTRFVCAVDNATVAYNAMRDAINGSSEDNPLIIIAAGPMQVTGEGLSRADKDKRRFVTVISHSKWNNNHSANLDSRREWDRHDGWTWDGMKAAFGTEEGGGTRFIKILDQNHGKDYMGLFCPKENYDWILSSPARENPAYKKGAWDFLYDRISTCVKRDSTCFDPSDAGMVVYLLTGIDKTDPGMVREIMEHPVE